MRLTDNYGDRHLNIDEFIELVSKNECCIHHNLLQKYDGQKWIDCDKNNTLDQLINKGYKILNKHIRHRSWHCYTAIILIH